MCGFTGWHYVPHKKKLAEDFKNSSSVSCVDSAAAQKVKQVTDDQGETAACAYFRQSLPY